MHPHTPHDRRTFESPEFDDPTQPADRGVITERTRSTALAMLIAALLVAAIIVLIVLL
jgi:hypothetical protein